MQASLGRLARDIGEDDDIPTGEMGFLYLHGGMAKERFPLDLLPNLVPHSRA